MQTLQSTLFDSIVLGEYLFNCSTLAIDCLCASAHQELKPGCSIYSVRHVFGPLHESYLKLPPPARIDIFYFSPMNVFRRLFFCFSRRSNNTPKRSLSGSPRMSNSQTAAALYAATVSSSSIAGATPEEASEKRHHLKGAKGFTNPWDSYVDATPWQLLTGLGW